MADIPYKAWFAYIRNFLPATWPVLEMFSGPGEMAALARADGSTAFAMDNHFPFLAESGGWHVNADARAIPFRDNSLGALIAPNCGLNYLNHSDLQVHFSECQRVLTAGGSYIFDICPEERAIQLNDTTQTALAGKVRFAHSYQSARRVLETRVTINGEPEVTELHNQSIFTGNEIREAAEGAGFAIRVRTDNYGLPVKGSLTPVETWVLASGRGAAT